MYFEERMMKIQASRVLPLFHAIMMGDEGTFDAIIANDSDAVSDIFNECGWTALHIAALSHNLNILRKIITYRSILLFQRDQDGNTPLQLSILNLNIPTMKILIEKGSNINNRNYSLQNPYHNAMFVYKCNPTNANEVVRLLIQAGADPHTVDNRNCKPIYYAILHGSTPAAKLLLEHEDNLNAACHRGSLLLAAVTNCHSIDIIKTLVDRGISIDRVDNKGRTALHIAAANDHKLIIEGRRRFHHINPQILVTINQAYLDAVRILLEKGADVTAKDENEQTPLHAAARGGNVGVLKELIAKRPNLIHDLDKFRQTPLHCAASNGQLEALEYLISCVSDLNIQNIDLMTPLHLTAYHKQCYNDWPHNCFLTPLFCYGRQNDCAVSLLRHGAAPSLPDIEGNTPLGLAVLTNNTLIYNTLSFFNANGYI